MSEEKASENSKDSGESLSESNEERYLRKLIEGAGKKALERTEDFRAQFEATQKPDRLLRHSATGEYVLGEVAQEWKGFLECAASSFSVMSFNVNLPKDPAKRTLAIDGLCDLLKCFVTQMCSFFSTDSPILNVRLREVEEACVNASLAMTAEEFRLFKIQLVDDLFFSLRRQNYDDYQS